MRLKMSLDKQVGFIQAKILIKKGTNVFANKSDERRTLNFIIRPVAEHESRIMLDINRERRLNANHDTYYEDKGKITDPEIYRGILDDLQSSLQLK